MISFLNGLVFSLVNGLVVFSSGCLASYLLKEHSSLSLRVVAVGVFSLVHATVVVLFLGVVVRYLNVWSVPILSLVVSVVILYLCKAYRQPLIQPARQALRQTFSGRDYFLYIIAGLFVLQVVILLFKVVWLPPHIWDVFVYHLPPAVEWYQQGYIPPVLDTTVNRMNGAPLGMTVLAYWFFIFFRDDMLVEMPMLIWALLLVPVSVAVLRQSGVSRPWAFKFAVVIFFIPIVLMQAVTVKDHLGLNVGLVAGLLFLAEFIKHRQYRLLLVSAAAFGLVLGYKIAAPIHILVALLVFGILLWFRQRSIFTESSERITLLKSAGLAVGVIVLIGGYWYLRNLIVYGRLQGAYGMKLTAVDERIATDAGAVDAIAKTVEKASYLQSNLLEFSSRVFDYWNFYSADLAGISGYGPQFSAFGLVALVMALAAFFNQHLRQQPVFMLSSVAVLLFTVFMFVNYHVNSYRILSFFPMILIAYAGVSLFQSGLLGQKLGRSIINIAMVLSISWCLLTLLPPHHTNLLRLKEFVSLDAEARTSANFTRWFVIHRPNFYRLLDDISVTEPIAHVAYQGSRWQGEASLDAWNYLYVDRHWQRKIYSLHVPEYFNCSQDGRRCQPLPSLKPFLRKHKISLLSSCKVNLCLQIMDDELFEILPGLYFYRDQS